jgi:hypothetical protein
MWQPGFRRSSARSGSDDCGRVVAYSETVVDMQALPPGPAAKCAHTPRGNFRIFEGVLEGAGFHLQRILNIVESMPNRRPSTEFAALLGACFSSLT